MKKDKWLGIGLLVAFCITLSFLFLEKAQPKKLPE